MSVEFLEQLDDGSIRLRILWDDNTLKRSVRWCGDIHLHEEMALDRGTDIRLEQGLTPTRALDPVIVNGLLVYADPTSFLINEGAGIYMTKKSRIIVREGSSLTIDQGGYIQLERGARIIVSDSSYLHIHPDAVVTGKGKIILSGGASADLDKKSVDVRIKSSRK